MKTPRTFLPIMTIALFLVLLHGRPAVSAPVVVDFEQFTGMNYWSGQPIPESARLYDQLLPTLGVVFTSGSPYVAVVNLEAGHATSGVNGIGGSTPDGILTYSPDFPIVITFFQPANPSVPATTNFVSVRGDLIGGGQPITLNAYDLNGNLVDSFTTDDSGGALLQVSTSTPQIHWVQFLGPTAGGGVGLDDLTFNPTTPHYNFGGILPPINADGTSVFKLKSTVPVKFRLFDDAGNAIGTAVARIYVAKIADQVVGTEMEPASTAAATEGNLFRYDPTEALYIFNLGTKGLSTGTWQIRIELDDNTSQYVNISLK